MSEDHALIGNGRTLVILRELAASPDGLSAPDLLDRLGENGKSRQKLLSWYGNILRTNLKLGRVEVAGKTEGGWQRCPQVIYRITAEGRDHVTYIDDAPRRQAEEAALIAAMESAAITRRQALAEAATLYGGTPVPRRERRLAAAKLRDLGCTLEDIGTIFGVSREMIRQDLLPGTPPPPRSPSVPGQRFAAVRVAGSMVAIDVGKRTIYLTPAEARLVGEAAEGLKESRMTA